jgi:hypothetical protein
MDVDVGRGCGDNEQERCRDGDEDETKHDNQKKWRFSLADYSIIAPFHLAKYYDAYLM